MTKREFLTDLMKLLGGWCAVFFGVLITPENVIPLSYKYALSLIATFAFIIIGVIYFRWEKVALMQSTLRFWLIIILELSIIGEYVYIATVNLQLFYINGILIVTYNNVISGLLYFVALFFARDLGRKLVNRHKERESKGEGKSKGKVNI